MEQEIRQGKMDLHTHSHYSDGDLAPADIVRCAQEAGVTLLAVTDHDSMDGVAEALEAGRREGLTAAGYDVAPYLPAAQGVTTRLHIALALIRAGFANDTADAFQRFLRRGTPGFAALQRPGPAHVIALLREAGGIPVLAHPCHLRGNVHAIVQELVDLGIGGIEAYYTTSSPGQTALFSSLAAQHGLLVTCGSDFHGANRPAAQLGCAWTPAPALDQTRRALMQRL